jgi:hypothetical protein
MSQPLCNSSRIAGGVAMLFARGTRQHLRLKVAEAAQEVG